MISKISGFIETPDLSQFPICKIKYANQQWVISKLPNIIELRFISDLMCKDIKEPRVSFWHQNLEVGEMFGNGKLHRDGLGKFDEIHRLITFGGPATLGDDDVILYPNYVWEYNGSFLHRAQPTLVSCDRLLVRVSKTKLKHNNLWQKL